jgi:hypothetical protein
MPKQTTRLGLGSPFLEKINRTAGFSVTPKLCESFEQYTALWDARQQTHPPSPPYQPSVVGQNIVGSCRMLTQRQGFQAIVVPHTECIWIDDLKYEFTHIEGLTANTELNAIFDQCADQPSATQTP